MNMMNVLYQISTRLHKITTTREQNHIQTPHFS